MVSMGAMGHGAMEAMGPMLAMGSMGTMGSMRTFNKPIRAGKTIKTVNKPTRGGEDFKDCYTKVIHAQTCSCFYPSNHYIHTGANVYPLEQRCIITP